MPKQSTHIPVVRQWLQSLGILSAVSISRQEAEMKLAAYVPLLVDRFSDATFTKESLEYVAFRASKGFPTYSELAGWLHDWWRDHRPVNDFSRLAAPDMSASAQLDRQLTALAAEWDDPAGIRRRINELANDLMWLRVLCCVVSRHAPQHLGLFPPAALAALDDDAPSPGLPMSERPQPRYATPAQLDQLNPLPNGRTRDGPATAANDRGATPAAELRAAPVGPDAPDWDADADAIPF
jgi:hypothetical protein